MFDKIKSILTPLDVVPRYLGNPINRSSNTLFYYSPFRSKERTASLAVTSKYITDFGTNEKYDIISFVSKYYNISVLDACKLIARDFNIDISIDYTDRQLEIIKKRINEKKTIEQVIDNWYNSTYIKLCDQFRYWCEQEEMFKFKRIGVDNLRLIYMNKVKVEYLVEIFRNATDEDKVYLYKNKERLKKYEDYGYVQFDSVGEGTS